MSVDKKERHRFYGKRRINIIKIVKLFNDRLDFMFKKLLNEPFKFFGYL